VVPRIRKTQTVAEAFDNETWLQDVRDGGGLSWHGIREFLWLWDCLLDITLNDKEDSHIWTLDATGCYSSKSAYKVFFQRTSDIQAMAPTFENSDSNQMQVLSLVSNA
jgi:hypothetical protein